MITLAVAVLTPFILGTALLYWYGVEKKSPLAELTSAQDSPIQFTASAASLLFPKAPPVAGEVVVKTQTTTPTTTKTLSQPDKENKMKLIKQLITGIMVSIALTGLAWADITKDKAIEMALAAHPGTVEKAYQETKKGVEVWEVKIKGDDGHEWKSYYRVDSGELFMKKKDNEIVTEAQTS